MVGATSSEGFLVMNDKKYITDSLGVMYVHGAPKSNKFVAHVVQQHA